MKKQFNYTYRVSDWYRYLMALSMVVLTKRSLLCQAFQLNLSVEINMSIDFSCIVVGSLPIDLQLC